MVQKKCRNPVPFAIVRKDKCKFEPTGTMFMLDLKWPIVLSESNKDLKNTLTQLCGPVAEIFARRSDKRVIAQGECRLSDTACICVVLEQSP
jgi:hypothetical protein